MPVAVVMDFEGGTLEMYDSVIKVLDLTPGGPGVPGALFHWAAKSPTGIRVTDVWDTMGDFEAFQAHLAPATQAAGMTIVPDVTVYEVHNHFVAA
jgi:hypothetical protein